MDANPPKAAAAPKNPGNLFVGGAGGAAAVPPTATYPTVITITGRTAVVVQPYGYTVALINLTTRHAYPPITVGAYPSAVAITG